MELKTQIRQRLRVFSQGILRDYATIIGVARKIPQKILQEDSKILMWYDQAVTRTGGGDMMAKKQVFKPGLIKVTGPTDSKSLFHGLRGCVLENNRLWSCQVNLIEREK